MDRQEILQELKMVIAPFTGRKELLSYVNEQTNLLTDLHINSSHLVDLIINAEEKYNIEFDQDSIEKMITVGDCIDIILSKMEQSHETNSQ